MTRWAKHFAPRKKQVRNNKQIWYSEECIEAKKKWRDIYESNFEKRRQDPGAEIDTERVNFEWNRYRKICRTFLRRHERAQAKHRESLRTTAPKEYWLDMIPTQRQEYDGRWSPDELAEYFSTVNQDRFTPSNDIMEIIEATIAFADEWRREFKDQ